MRIGLISDIHAHVIDLRQALTILTDQGVDKILCAGDLVEKGPRGDEVVSLLQAWLIPCVRGNHDENAVRHARRGFGKSELSRKSLEVLADLPTTRHYCWEGQRIVVAHGIPSCNKTYVYATKVPKALKRDLRTLDADVLVTGHSHRPMDTALAGVRVLNPGSVRGIRPRDSHTCGVLDLKDRSFRVLCLKTGRPYRL